MSKNKKSTTLTIKRPNLIKLKEEAEKQQRSLSGMVDFILFERYEKSSVATGFSETDCFSKTNCAVCDKRLTKEGDVWYAANCNEVFCSFECRAKPLNKGAER